MSSGIGCHCGSVGRIFDLFRSFEIRHLVNWVFPDVIENNQGKKTKQKKKEEKKNNCHVLEKMIRQGFFML
jgi:hypothetical protein